MHRTSLLKSPFKGTRYHPFSSEDHWGLCRNNSVAFQLIKDLIQFVPFGIPQEWTEINEISPGKPVVILISGFGAYPGSLRVMRKRLLRDGFNVVVQTLSYQSINDSISGFSWLAQNLNVLVQALRNKEELKNQKIFIVAHSAGGLVARHFIQHLNGERSCDGLVTLATPHRGLWFASLGFLTHLIVKARCIYDILPISHFVRDLNSADFPKNFPMISIYSHADVLCSVKTTRLPPILAQCKSVSEHSLTEVSHMEFLIRKEPYLVIKKWFESQNVSFSSPKSTDPLKAIS